MNILKTSIFVACIIGIISCLADIAAPKGTMKNQIKIITSLILILAVFTPFMGEEFDIDFKSLEKLTDTEKYQSMTEDFKDMYIGMTAEKMEEEIKRLIKEQNVDIEKVVIDSDYDEYNSLEVRKVTVYAESLTENEKETINRVIGENLPEAEIEFSQESL